MTRLGGGDILLSILGQFTPVWIAMAMILGLSYVFRKRLGLYGRLFDSPIGMVGLVLVLFWVLTAIFADMIITFDPLDQLSLSQCSQLPRWDSWLRACMRRHRLWKLHGMLCFMRARQVRYTPE